MQLTLKAATLQLERAVLANETTAQRRRKRGLCRLTPGDAKPDAPVFFMPFQKSRLKHQDRRSEVHPHQLSWEGGASASPIDEAEDKIAAAQLLLWRVRLPWPLRPTEENRSRWRFGNTGIKTCTLPYLR